MSMQEAVEVFQLAENAFGERMVATGNLFDPALGVEAGLLAALPYLTNAAQPVVAEPAQPADSGRVGQLMAKWRGDEAEEGRYSGEYYSGLSKGIERCADELEAALAAQGQGEAAMLKALRAIKLRLHFMGWPAEPMWNNGTPETPHWIADWRYEIALLEHALHGSPVIANEKPADTVPRNSLPASPAGVSDVRAMVDRFLGWRLPDDFSPDCGISFDGRKDDQWNTNKTWPVGTNLLTAMQATAMVEYMLATPAPQSERVPERCEGGTPECGPVEHWDSEGVPLCAKCWEELCNEAAPSALTDKPA